MYEKENLSISLLRKGKRAVEVAQEINVHPTTVQRWAKKYNIPLTYPYNRHEKREDLVNVEEIIRLREKMSNGKPMFTRLEIAGMCNCSESYVKRVIAKTRKDKNT